MHHPIIVISIERHMRTVARLATVHLHGWHVWGLPSSRAMTTLLKVEGQLVLVGHLWDDMRRIGRGHSRCCERLSLEKCLVGHIQLLVLFGILPVGFGIKRRPEVPVAFFPELCVRFWRGFVVLDVSKGEALLELDLLEDPAKDLSSSCSGAWLGFNDRMHNS